MLKKGIKRKIVFSLVITVLAVMSVFIVILDKYLKDYSIRESDRTISFLGKNASTLLQKPLFDSDYNQLSNIVQPIILEDFDYVLIFDNSTQNIAFKEDKMGLSDHLSLTEAKRNQLQEETLPLEIKGKAYKQYIFPITSLGVSKPLGSLVIGVSQNKIQSKLRGITDRIVSIGLLFFLILIIIIYLLSYKIAHPIKQLSEKIGKFASGNYDVRSDISTDDEIGNLSCNFNLMADKINEQILSIEEYNKNLEIMVEERTDELLKALDAIREKDTKLIHAEKINSLNSIVSSIAHEINNPLSIISGNIQMLEAKVDNPLFQKKLKSAGEAIVRITKLIDEINFFASIKDITFCTVAFGKILNECVEKVVLKEVPVSIDGNTDDKIQTNTYLLSVCLENILKNSVEMIKARNLLEMGNIEVKYAKDEVYFFVDIIDNAGGFDDPLRAFDPFYTTFESKKGLGLTFVYHAVKALNGEIKIENINDGSKITIMLPIEIFEGDLNICQQ